MITSILGTQVHCGSSKWDGVPLPSLAPSAKSSCFGWKPAGFWTSSLLEDGSSGWMGFTEMEFDPTTDHLYEVVGEPNLLFLETNLDVLDALRRAGLMDNNHEIQHVQDIAVARVWDNAIIPQLWDWAWETHDGVYVPARSREMSHVLSTWDVESTCWFRPWDNLRLVSPSPSLPCP